MSIQQSEMVDQEANNLKIATIQMVSTSNWQANLVTADKLIAQAKEEGAQLIVLPEFFIRLADTRCREFRELIEDFGSGQLQNWLSLTAQKYQVYLVGGTIPLKADHASKCYNACIVHDPQGKLVCCYRKIHLFKFDNGEQRFDEGESFTSGNDIVTFNAYGFNFGLSVCYDLRFPELFRNMANIDAIILPAAFVYHTGQAHWEILLRARAIENQCYVIASNQGGIHDNGRHSFGHSMLINPWGRVKAVLEHGEGIVVGYIKRSTLERVRTQLPALQHRRF